MIPTQKIRMLPTSERSFNTASVIKPESTTARAVMLPYSIVTGIKENIQPLPMDDAMKACGFDDRILISLLQKAFEQDAQHAAHRRQKSVRRKFQFGEFR